MKVVLIQLPSPWLINDRDLPLLGVLYLAASLRRAGIEVQIADLVGLPEKHWYIPEGDVYGVSLTTPQVPYAKQVIQRIRTRTEHDTTIVVGGPHVSALPLWSLDNLDADYAFVGEADIEFPRFLIEGASSMSRIIRCDPVDVRQLPLPARDLVDIRSFHGGGKIYKYIKDFHYGGFMATGRGCPYNCAFCGQRAVTCGNVRFNTVSNVVQEVLELTERYECDLIYLEDDTFNLSMGHTMELCAAFSEIVNFDWHCNCRVDLVNPLMLSAMQKAGCKNIALGFESGSDYILDLMDKRTTVAANLRAAQLVTDAGMTVRGQIIVGFPGETDKTIAETEQFIRDASVHTWSFHACIPVPGSSIWNDSEKFGLEIDKEREDFEEGYHTVGKSGVWAKVWVDGTSEWLAYLRQIAGEKNVDYGSS